MGTPTVHPVSWTTRLIIKFSNVCISYDFKVLYVPVNEKLKDAREFCIL
jgi:hypothetical protein